jgi:WD40 repeat protein
MSIDRDIPLKEVHWAAIKPDGSGYVAGSVSGAISMYSFDDTTHPELMHYGHSTRVTSGAFTNDGKRLVTGDMDGRVHMWNLDDSRRKRMYRLSHGNSAVCAIAFDPMSEKIQYARCSGYGPKNGPGECGDFDLTTNEHQFTQRATTHYQTWPRSDFSFSRDGSFMASPAKEAARPPGRLILGYPQGEINVWSTLSNELLCKIDIGREFITGLCFSLDNQQLAVATFQQTSLTAGVSSVAFIELSDGINSKETLAPKHKHRITDTRITAMCYSKSGRLAVATPQEIYTLSRDGSPKLLSQWQDAVQTSVNFHPTANEIVVADFAGFRVRVLNSETGATKFDVDAPRAVCSVQYSPNGRRFAMVGYDSRVYFCDAQTGRRLLILDGSNGDPGTAGFTAQVCFSLDGRRIAANTFNGGITVWEISSSTADSGSDRP